MHVSPCTLVIRKKKKKIYVLAVRCTRACSRVSILPLNSPIYTLLLLYFSCTKRALVTTECWMLDARRRARPRSYRFSIPNGSRTCAPLVVFHVCNLHSQSFHILLPLDPIHKWTNNTTILSIFCKRLFFQHTFARYNIRELSGCIARWLGGDIR